MKRHGMMLLLALLPLIPGRALAQAEPTEPAADSFELGGEAAAGARLGDVSGSREKFLEYSDTVDELLLDLRARYQRPASGDFLELDVRSPNQRDESYRATVGRRGRYRLSVAYDGLLHQYTGGRFLWGGLGTGTLRIADPVQRELEASYPLNTDFGPQPGSEVATPNPNPSPPIPLDVQQQAIARGLYDAADDVTFALERRAVSSALEVSLPAGASAWVRFRNENRSGARAVGAGTYERWFDFGGTDARHSVDRFMVIGAEVAEPLDHRTLGVAAGAGVQREAWLADVEYSLTRFRNADDVLLYDNPFRATDAEATGPLTAAGGGGALNRGRGALQYLGLAQDSLAHDVTLSGAVDLPMHGRLAASASYGMITQDQAFQPYTRNTAIDTAVDASTGTVTAPAATLPLPQSDLDGDVRTLAGTLSATVRPLRPLTLAAKYRAYRYDGKSDEIRFPGYAAFGDSLWRTKRNDPSPLGGFTNDVFDYWRHEADVDSDYRVSRLLSVTLSGGWEGWRYSHLRLDRSDEYAVGAGFTVRPARNASVAASYRFADRTIDGYLQGNTGANPEARGLLNFNWAERRRHQASVRAQYAPAAMVSLGVAGSVVDDDYGGETEGGGAIDRFRFGRSEARRWLGSADVTVTPAERLSVYGTYAVELREEERANAAKDNPVKGADDFGVADSFAPENYWNSTIDETVNSVGVGASVELVPGRLALDTGYNLSFSDMDVETTNPNPIRTDPASPTLANAVAQPWPRIKNRLHEVFADLGYRFTPRVRAGVRYLFASYDLDDFAWELQQPYMAGVSAENTTRYVFANATYDSYRAHVGTAYFAGSF